MCLSTVYKNEKNPENVVLQNVMLITCEDGKVKLVDVVMLNRFLTGYDDQDLGATAAINANCFRSEGESDADTDKAKHLDGKDSISILRYLIGKISHDELPEK